MLSHNQIKYINSLKIKKYRAQHGAFVVEGEKGVAELLASDFVVLKVVALKKWLDQNNHLIVGTNAEIIEVTESELGRISDLTTPNCALAVAAIPECEIPELISEKLVIALDGVRNPGNLGTIIRTADWFGIRNIVCSADCVDIYNPKAVQATMGSFARVKVYYTDLVNYFNSLPANVHVYGAFLEGEDLVAKQFSKPGVLLLGSESHGTSERLRPFVTDPVHIPRLHEVTGSTMAESLNVSVANAIICYEICKQL